MRRKAGVALWDHPEPTVRPVPVELSRETIVRAAIALADNEGLAAATLRNVATALGAGHMRLYGYFLRKDELLDLMIDAIFAEVDRPADSLGWRERIHGLARECVGQICIIHGSRNF